METRKNKTRRNVANGETLADLSQKSSKQSAHRHTLHINRVTQFQRNNRPKPMLVVFFLAIRHIQLIQLFGHFHGRIDAIVLHFFFGVFRFVHFFTLLQVFFRVWRLDFLLLDRRLVFFVARGWVRVFRVEFAVGSDVFTRFVERFFELIRNLKQIGNLKWSHIKKNTSKWSHIKKDTSKWSHIKNDTSKWSHIKKDEFKRE